MDAYAATLNVEGLEVWFHPGAFALGGVPDLPISSFLADVGEAKAGQGRGSQELSCLGIVGLEVGPPCRLQLG